MFLVNIITKGTNSGENFTFFATGYSASNAGVLTEIGVPTPVVEMIDHSLNSVSIQRIVVNASEIISSGSTFVSIGTGTNGWQITVTDPNSRAVVAARG